jgi:rod shape-determining protein MreC
MIVESKKPVWIMLAVVLLFHTLTISLQANRRVDTRFMRGWLLDSLAPVEKLVDTVLNGAGNIWSGYFALVGVNKQNQELRAQLDDYRMRLERQNEDVLEAQRMRALVGLKDSIAGRSVVARVIGGDSSKSQTVTIDKGLSHGVHPDSAVVTAQGIVGRVIYSSNFFSIVQLILDSQSGVGVMVRSTRRQGILKGNGSGQLDLDNIDEDNELMEGDEFLTSGLDRIYPKGLPVGTITSVGPRVGLFKSVTVRPKVDFGRLEEVLCITDRPETVDVLDPASDLPLP